MAVRGLELFSERFTEYRDAFILIGGAACDLWFSDQSLRFRATKDLDIVLILDRLNPAFIQALEQFVDEGQYENRFRNEDTQANLYRFEKPADASFPYMLEFFSRLPEDMELFPNQHIVPIRMDDAASLSAILLNNAYYHFLLDHCRTSRGIQVADGHALIPLKARAWLDLNDRQQNGEEVKGDDIRKHRNDVFRLAVTLPSEPIASVPAELAEDVRRFLEFFPPQHAEWTSIQQSMRPMIGGTISPEILITAIQKFFRIGTV